MSLKMIIWPWQKCYFIKNRPCVFSIVYVLFFLQRPKLTFSMSFGVYIVNYIWLINIFKWSLYIYISLNNSFGSKYVKSFSWNVFNYNLSICFNKNIKYAITQISIKVNKAYFKTRWSKVFIICLFSHF